MLHKAFTSELQKPPGTGGWDDGLGRTNGGKHCPDRAAAFPYGTVSDNALSCAWAARAAENKLIKEHFATYKPGAA